ncbi:MAG: YbhB/YbcL family Raf kinase inhibitor-like protein [Actinobacteria bacterium]|nr:YbhB/YbcL family Raf kinase inhibitor-like protein [Actinomycetota bacterium]
MKKLLLLIIIFALIFSGCSTKKEEKISSSKKEENKSEKTITEEVESFKLTSPAFSDGEEIPVKYCMQQIEGGKNVSPPLEWTDPPSGTKSFAIVCIDTHPIANGWIHWIVVNIPASWRKIDEGASGTEKMNGALELMNSFGFKGWGGPMPPQGSGEHKYEFHIFALPTEKAALPTKIKLDEKILSLLRKSALSESVLVGIFKR